MAAAEPGHIVATSTVKDLTSGSGIRFIDLGEHRPKGTPDRWRLFDVLVA